MIRAIEPRTLVFVAMLLTGGCGHRETATLLDQLGRHCEQVCDPPLTGALTPDRCTVTCDRPSPAPCAGNTGWFVEDGHPSQLCAGCQDDIARSQACSSLICGSQSVCPIPYFESGVSICGGDGGTCDWEN